MKHQLFLTLLLAMCALPHGISAKKVSTLATDVELRAEPDNRAAVVGRVPAGETVTVLESGLPDFWVKVEGPDGSVGYTDSGALDYPSGLETDAAEAEAPVETVDGISVRRDEAGHPVCAVIRPTPVYYRKDRSKSDASTLAAGTLLSVREVDSAANSVTALLNGNAIYLALSDVDFDSRRFPREEAVAEPLRQKAVPRDGAYRVARKGMRVFLGKPASRDVREDVFDVGDVISGAAYINDEWLAIPFEGVQAYVLRRDVRKMKLYELVRAYGEEAPVVQAERELIDRTPGFSVFNGVRAGLYGVWLIVAAALALAVITYRRFMWDKEPAPKAIVRYGWLLVLLSVLEMWYLLSLGTDDAAWFLGARAGDKAWVNFFFMLAVTAVQGFGIFRYAENVERTRRFSFSKRWMFGGIVLSLILYGIWLLTNMNDEIPSSSKAPVILLVAFLGQIPQVLAILVSFLRRRRERLPGPPSIAGVLLTYWIALVGMICLGALSAVMLVALALMALGAYYLLRNMPSMFHDAAQETLAGTARQGRYSAAFGRLDDLVRSGRMDAERAREHKDNLQGLMDQGKDCPEKLDF